MSQTINDRLQDLRALFSQEGIQAFIIPSTDPHLSSSTECPSLGARKDRRESGRKHGYQARRDNTVIYSPIRRTVCMAMVG